jgi:hypothetical protein
MKSKIRRWTLFLGVLQVTVGCVVGFLPPTVVQWFRGVVMAHIEFTANGVLMVVLGLLLNEMELGATALWAWFVALVLGTWTNGAAGVLAAFSGSSSKLMGTLNEKFPPPGGADNAGVTLLLMLCGVTIMIALLLSLYGLLAAKPKRGA